MSTRAIAAISIQPSDTEGSNIMMLQGHSATPPDPSGPQRDACQDQQTKDYFVRRNGLCYAGIHLLVELWEADHLDDLPRVDAMLRDAVRACRATLLNLHLHRFSPNGGISGVAVLAESHISIHTWPERNYAAVDIFMCGDADPYKAIPVMRRALTSDRVQICEQKRGLLP